jgi:hypothetical protein
VVDALPFESFASVEGTAGAAASDVEVDTMIPFVVAQIKTAIFYKQGKREKKTEEEANTVQAAHSKIDGNVVRSPSQLRNGLQSRKAWMKGEGLTRVSRMTPAYILYYILDHYYFTAGNQ